MNASCSAPLQYNPEMSAVYLVEYLTRQISKVLDADWWILQAGRFHLLVDHFFFG
jgi:hypothetical protein